MMTKNDTELKRLDSMVADLRFCLDAIGPDMDPVKLKKAATLLIESELMLKQLKQEEFNDQMA
jgi:hypothetical protein